MKGSGRRGGNRSTEEGKPFSREYRTKKALITERSEHQARRICRDSIPKVPRSSRRKSSVIRNSLVSDIVLFTTSA